MKKNILNDNLTTINPISIGISQLPSILLVGQLHGDEYASAYILSQLIKQLKKNKNRLKYRAEIIVYANRLGAIMGIKDDPLSGYNLNRSFNDKVNDLEPQDKPVKEITKRITQLVSKSQLVVDLHDMPGSALPVCGIYTQVGDKTIDQLSLEFLKTFKPDVVWTEDFRKEKDRIRYSGTINQKATSFSIPTFTIETSPIEVITENQVDQIIEGLMRIFYGKREDNRLNIIVRKELYSPATGIFISEDQLLKVAVNEGDLLGRVIIPDGKDILIRSSFSGILVRKSLNRFVRNGDKLFDIGVTK